jgi:hypothetical protein
MTEETIHVPPADFQNVATLLRTIERLGFVVPGAVKALAASGQPIRQSARPIDLHALNAKLSLTNLSTAQRIALKSGLTKHGLLPPDEPVRFGR